jgi:predicted NACHT family NTPase
VLGTRRRIRRALRRVQLTESQARLVRLLFREEERERASILKRLAECRRKLHAAFAPPVPDSEIVLELSRREKQLQDRERALSGLLEARIAALLGPAQAAELRRLLPPPLSSEPPSNPVVARLSALPPRLSV